MADDRRVTVLYEHGEATSPAVSEVVTAAATAGLEVTSLAVKDDLDAMVAGLRARRPQLVVNLVRRFAGNPRLAPDVAAALELLDIPYTGAPPAGLYLGADPQLARRLLDAHGIEVAEPGEHDLSFAAIGNERLTVVAADNRARHAVTHLACRVFAALRLRDYGLLRVRLTDDGPPVLVAAAPNPLLGRDDELARVCEGGGLPYDPLLAWVLDEAWERHLATQPTAKSL
jgi:D-alanine-D-alanine ligase-like ATP-grasp enzyme